MEDVLTVTGLKAYYQTHYYGVDREVQAVDDVSLTIRKNEIYGIAGESSSGKTSLIKALAGAIRPPLRIVAGTVRYAFSDKVLDVYSSSPEDLAAIRWKHLSYIMQGSMNVLNPVRRIRESFVDFAFRHIGKSRAEFDTLIEEHVARLDLPPRVLDAFPHELSGGMRQRVTIALATVCKPEFIIADEPTTALDVVVQRDVLAMIRDIQQQMKASVVFVTHDMSVHAAITDRIGIVYAGRLVEDGATADVFGAPKHPYTRHLIASLPRIGDVSEKKGLEGSPPNLANPPSGCRFHPRCPLATTRCRSETPMIRTGDNGHRVACHIAS